MAVGMHGSTFGGNPLATSVGNVVLEELLSPSFLENVEITGKYLKHKLEDLASQFLMIVVVRRKGLMLGYFLMLASSTVLFHDAIYGTLQFHQLPY